MKKFVVCCLTLALAVCMVACGGNDAGEAATDTQATVTQEA